MAFVRREGALFYTGGQSEEEERAERFHSQALLLLGFSSGQIESVNGREPTVAEIKNGTPRNNAGLVTGTLQQNLFPEEDKRGVQIPHTHDLQLQHILEETLHGSTEHPKTHPKKHHRNHH